MIFNVNGWGRFSSKTAKKAAKKRSNDERRPYGWGYESDRDGWGNLIGRNQYGILISQIIVNPDLTGWNSPDANAGWNSPEAIMSRRLTLSMRYKILDRRMSVMNCIPRCDGWTSIPRFNETEKVVRLSFYFRTIVKTCFLHLKEGLPNLPPGLLDIILEYADDHIFVKNNSLHYTGLERNHSNTTLYSLLADKFLEL